jgi:hypothetical protein
VTKGLFMLNFACNSHKLVLLTHRAFT